MFTIIVKLVNKEKVTYFNSNIIKKTVLLGAGSPDTKPDAFKDKLVYFY